MVDLFVRILISTQTFPGTICERFWKYMGILQIYTLVSHESVVSSTCKTHWEDRCTDTTDMESACRLQTLQGNIYNTEKMELGTPHNNVQEGIMSYLYIDKYGIEGESI